MLEPLLHLPATLDFSDNPVQSGTGLAEIATGLTHSDARWWGEPVWNFSQHHTFMRAGEAEPLLQFIQDREGGFEAFWTPGYTSAVKAVGSLAIAATEIRIHSVNYDTTYLTDDRDVSVGRHIYVINEEDGTLHTSKVLSVTADPDPDYEILNLEDAIPIEFLEGDYHVGFMYHVVLGNDFNIKWESPNIGSVEFELSTTRDIQPEAPANEFNDAPITADLTRVPYLNGGMNLNSTVIIGTIVYITGTFTEVGYHERDDIDSDWGITDIVPRSGSAAYDYSTNRWTDWEITIPDSTGRKIHDSKGNIIYITHTVSGVKLVTAVAAFDGEAIWNVECDADTLRVTGNKLNVGRGRGANATFTTCYCYNDDYINSPYFEYVSLNGGLVNANWHWLDLYDGNYILDPENYGKFYKASILGHDDDNIYVCSFDLWNRVQVLGLDMAPGPGIIKYSSNSFSVNWSTDKEEVTGVWTYNGIPVIIHTDPDYNFVWVAFQPLTGGQMIPIRLSDGKYPYGNRIIGSDMDMQNNGSLPVFEPVEDVIYVANVSSDVSNKVTPMHVYDRATLGRISIFGVEFGLNTGSYYKVKIVGNNILVVGNFTSNYTPGTCIQLLSSTEGRPQNMEDYG